MITLDKQISIMFIDPVGINKAGTYRYEVYLSNHDYERVKTIFVGNVFLNENQSELRLDITSIVRSYYNTNDIWETIGYTRNQETTTYLFFDAKLYGENDEENTSEDYAEVNMMYVYPNYKAELNAGLDYTTNTGGSLWVSLQGRYGESGIGKFKLTPHYPFISTQNYCMALQGYANNAVLGRNNTIKINGNTISKTFYINFNNYFWRTPLNQLFSNVTLDKEGIVDIAGDEVAIIDICPARYYLMWKDRAGSYQSQRFEGVETFTESFSKEFVINSTGYKKPNTIGINPKIKIQTGFIDDELYPYYESIFVSPQLLLYDTKEDRSYPVNVTGDFTEKTFKNQGRQFFNLQLDLEFATQQNIIY